jgi:hypothetical protein
MQLIEVKLKTSTGPRRFLIDEGLVISMGVPNGPNVDVCRLFVASWISLLADSPLPSGAKPARVFNNFLANLVRDGLKATVLKYTEFAHELVASATNMGAGSSIGSWISGMKDTPIFKEYLQYFNTGDSNVLRYIYTFLNFGKKLDYVDESFNETAFRSWIAIEEKLKGFEYESSDLSALKVILSTLLPRLTFKDFRPKFGPGSVQERGVRGRLAKLQTFSYDPLIDRFLFRGHLGNYGLGEEFGLSASKVIPRGDDWSAANNHSSRTARLRFVPKNLKVSRSICMEPNTSMYFQQGVNREMMRVLQSTVFGSFFRIHDQSRNQDLAHIGSITSEIDTLDLSAASDSVSVTLVKAIMPPSWLIPMLVTRSGRAILPDGTLYNLEKFAPMGSALCFPTQSIIFASVCIYAACRYDFERSRHRSFDEWLTPSRIRSIASSFTGNGSYSTKGFQPLAVYGDDICVDQKLTPHVTSILSRLAFTVNDSKSFVGGQAFRESCGKYYMSGCDITPLYFRVKGVKRQTTASHVASQVQLANAAWRMGYKNLYRTCRRLISVWGRRDGVNAIPYILPDSPHFGLISEAPVNSHVKTRYNPDYQRDEIRVWTITYDWLERPSDLSLVDSYEYMRWWVGRSREFETADSMAVSRSDRGGARIRWRWIPTY